MDQLGLDREKRSLVIIKKLRKATVDMIEPAVTSIVKDFGQNPFLVLVSCILSLRTKDTVSLPTSRKLFLFAKTPQGVLDLSLEKIEEIIYPVGFYRNKARHLHEISRDLIGRFGGFVPDNEKDLLSLKGVGRKTANLVLGEGFGIPAICVDTHVHRISNRLGLVNTKTPKDTEVELKNILPKKYWIEYNRLLVQWGQNVCMPVSPFCSKCKIYDLCSRVGIKNSR